MRYGLILRAFLVCLGICSAFRTNLAEESATQSFEKWFDAEAVSKAIKNVQPATVVVQQKGRDGDVRGKASGFVIDAEEALVATNFHVIGEGRPVEVVFQSGQRLEVSEIYASSPSSDLAILKLETVEPLASSLTLRPEIARQGEMVLGFGNPQGLQFSVVPGLVSAVRELDAAVRAENEELPDFELLQLAMPIEQGNSGGPVVDREGQVVGVVTLRHRVTTNLGFAVPSRELQQLLETPNRVSIERWQVLGQIDRRIWEPLMGADWGQKNGAVTVSEPGDGFGGRSLCLYHDEPSAGAYETAVEVRLEAESGAAGLVLGADGGERHIGVYPSNGRIRVTVFGGADVYSWNILDQIETPSYRPGSWNKLRTRLDKGLLTVWVNGDQVFEQQLGPGQIFGNRVGLCKFRDTSAEFRYFEMGRSLDNGSLDAEEVERLDRALTLLMRAGDSGVAMKQLTQSPRDSRAVIEQRRREIQKQLVQLDELERELHTQQVSRELVMALDKPEEEIDLFEMALQIAALDDDELHLQHYRDSFGRLVHEADLFIQAQQGDSSSEAEILRRFLFEECGYHGSRSEYYNPANSHINRVLDDREGLPITLSLLFLEMARRLSISPVYGVPLPGQFMVGFASMDQDSQKPTRRYLNVFDNAEILDRKQASDVIVRLTGRVPKSEDFRKADARSIARRMLQNLIAIQVDQERQPVEALPYLDALLAIAPDSGSDRFRRALILFEKKAYEKSISDLDWLLHQRPPGIDYEKLSQFREMIADQLSTKAAE